MGEYGLIVPAHNGLSSEPGMDGSTGLPDVPGPQDDTEANG